MRTSSCAFAVWLENLTADTLRHTFDSVAGDLCYSELVVASMLGRGKRGVTHVYVYIEDGLRMAIECASGQIKALLDDRLATITPINSIPMNQEVITKASERRKYGQLQAA